MSKIRSPEFFNMKNIRIKTIVFIIIRYKVLKSIWGEIDEKYEELYAVKETRYMKSLKNYSVRLYQITDLILMKRKMEYIWKYLEVWQSM